MSCRCPCHGKQQAALALGDGPVPCWPASGTAATARQAFGSSSRRLQAPSKSRESISPRASGVWKSATRRDRLTGLRAVPEPNLLAVGRVQERHADPVEVVRTVSEPARVPLRLGEDILRIHRRLLRLDDRHRLPVEKQRSSPPARAPWGAPRCGTRRWARALSHAATRAHRAWDRLRT